jgi:hypothetical protein
MLTECQLADAVLCRRGSHRRPSPGHGPPQHHLIIRRPHQSKPSFIGNSVQVHRTPPSTPLLNVSFVWRR